MVPIARRNLFQDKLRFLISSGGVAFAIMLMLVLNGIFSGMRQQITAYLDNTPIQFIVSQKKLRNFLGANSTVPLSSQRSIRKVKGVKKVVPVFVSYVVLDLEGRREFSLLIGFDPKKGGGPWQMEEGNKDIKKDEVIFDSVVTKRYNLNKGDKVDILGRDFTIKGLSGGTSSWMTGTFFITFDAASELLAAKNSTGFLLVSTDDSASAKEVEKNITRAVKNLTVTTKEEMAENDFNLYAETFSGPLQFMVSLAFLIGVLLVGLAIYTATVERAKEYGVLKAIGIKNFKLYLVVFEQALIASVAGFFLGIIFAFGAVKAINNFAPQFLVVIEWPYMVQVFFAALAMSVLASYIPVRAVARLDPAIAFRRGV